MKLLLDIQTDKLTAFLNFIENFTDVKAEKITEKDADLFQEIKEIELAFQHAKLISAKELSSRPVEDLLNEL
jgi:F0F1-type ATP synthase delta subunit